jgi:hypothetical protein
LYFCGKFNLNEEGVFYRGSGLNCWLLFFGLAAKDSETEYAVCLANIVLSKKEGN